MKIVVLALLAATLACFGRHNESVEPLGDIPLRVANRNWYDVVVYVVHDGQRTRLGTVTRASEQSFSLHGQLLGPSHQLALFGQAIGSNEVARTETLVIHPGQSIKWILEIDLRRSSVGVY